MLLSMSKFWDSVQLEINRIKHSHDAAVPFFNGQIVEIEAESDCEVGSSLLMAYILGGMAVIW